MVSSGRTFDSLSVESARVGLALITCRGKWSGLMAAVCRVICNIENTFGVMYCKRAPRAASGLLQPSTIHSGLPDVNGYFSFTYRDKWVRYALRAVLLNGRIKPAARLHPLYESIIIASPLRDVHIYTFYKLRLIIRFTCSSYKIAYLYYNV